MSEISEVIVAEWIRMVTTGADMDLAALTTAFNDIVDLNCKALKDGDGTSERPLMIVVPLPPVNGLTGAAAMAALDTYLQNNHDLLPGLGPALLFGCGR